MQEFEGKVSASDLRSASWGSCIGFSPIRTYNPQKTIFSSRSCFLLWLLVFLRKRLVLGRRSFDCWIEAAEAARFCSCNRGRSWWEYVWWSSSTWWFPNRLPAKPWRRCVCEWLRCCGRWSSSNCTCATWALLLGLHHARLPSQVPSECLNYVGSTFADEIYSALFGHLQNEDYKLANGPEVFDSLLSAFLADGPVLVIDVIAGPMHLFGDVFPLSVVLFYQG